MHTHRLLRTLIRQHLCVDSQPRLNLAAAIAQCPFLGIRPPAPFTLGTLKIFGYALLDALKQALGLAPLYIPAAAPPRRCWRADCAWLCGGSVSARVRLIVQHDLTRVFCGPS